MAPPIIFPLRKGPRGAVPWRPGLQVALPQPGPPPAGPISLADNCIFTPTMGGLTDWSASAPVQGSRMPIEAGCIIGNRYNYVARSADQTQWEGGLGTCWGEYIARTTVLWSSNGGLAVNFSVVPTVSLDALAADISGRRNQRSVTTSPVVVLPTDQVLNFNCAFTVFCQLPPSASRTGVPLTGKDAGGQATVNNIAFLAAPGETIDGQPSYILYSNFAGVTFVPFADGVNTGWSVE